MEARYRKKSRKFKMKSFYRARYRKGLMSLHFGINIDSHHYCHFPFLPKCSQKGGLFSVVKQLELFITFNPMTINVTSSNKWQRCLLNTCTRIPCKVM